MRQPDQDVATRSGRYTGDPRSTDAGPRVPWSQLFDLRLTLPCSHHHVCEHHRRHSPAQVRPGGTDCHFSRRFVVGFQSQRGEIETRTAHQARRHPCARQRRLTSATESQHVVVRLFVDDDLRLVGPISMLGWWGRPGSCIENGLTSTTASNRLAPTHRPCAVIGQPGSWPLTSSLPKRAAGYRCFLRS
jgi:hypothetical protein